MDLLGHLMEEFFIDIKNESSRMGLLKYTKSGSLQKHLKKQKKQGKNIEKFPKIEKDI